MTHSDLAERQRAFLDAIVDDSAPLPEGWGNSQAMGMTVYRGNYRSALIGALESTFERTRLYMGDGPFKQAAINHAISHPPSGWTIDEVGAGFDQTCQDLFPENPEVSDLAWLEWSMLQLATAGDEESITPDQFALMTSEFGDQEWIELTFGFQAEATAKVVATNLTGLWPTLDPESESERPSPYLEEPQGCLIWREGERPTFKLVDAGNAQAFAQAQQGASYGDLLMALAGDNPDAETVQQAAMHAGAILGDWLNEGIIIAIKA